MLTLSVPNVDLKNYSAFKQSSLVFLQSLLVVCILQTMPFWFDMKSSCCESTSQHVDQIGTVSGFYAFIYSLMLDVHNSSHFNMSHRN